MIHMMKYATPICGNILATGDENSTPVISENEDSELRSYYNKLSSHYLVNFVIEIMPVVITLMYGQD